MTVREMRQMLKLSQAKFGEKYGIPKRTIESWEAGERICPEYVLSLLERCVKDDVKNENRDVLEENPDIIKKEKSGMNQNKSIPSKFQIYFWDADINNLDIDENKYYIIARLYTKGNFDAIEWVHQTYTEKDIEETARKRRALDPIVANYLRQKYSLQKEEMAYYRTEEMGGHMLWAY